MIHYPLNKSYSPNYIWTSGVCYYSVFMVYKNPLRLCMVLEKRVFNCTLIPLHSDTHVYFAVQELSSTNIKLTLCPLNVDQAFISDQLTMPGIIDGKVFPYKCGYNILQNLASFKYHALFSFYFSSLNKWNTYLYYQYHHLNSYHQLFATRMSMIRVPTKL